jgi:O-antigen/teichoic acid export membrane protein
MIKKIVSLYKSSSSNRAAINTVVIYSQRFFAAALSLITTPIILNGLGVEDYGLYTLTIGFVGMLSFLNWSLSSSTQRYIAFAIGEGDLLKLKRIFSTSLVIHFLYGIVLLIVICFIGFFFTEKLLNIPVGKELVARNILFVVAFVTFFSIIAIPFLGILRANENFFAIASVGIIESVLKLIIAFIILLMAKDKLFVYALLLLIVSAITMGGYCLIVYKKYRTISISFRFYDKELVKEMLSFISWSFLGALSIMSRNQGVQVLVNLFFGVVRNAAYGIATQISVAISILSQGIIGSISPQIIKSAGAGDTKKMIFLMRTMSKFAIFSISIVAIPLFFECQTILEIWLGKVPTDTVIYVRLIIIFGQIMLLSAGIQTVFDALGKVKLYNIWVSFILILNLPISYVFFKLGFPSYSIIVVGMCLEMISLNVRLQLLKKYVNFSVKDYYYDTIFRVFLPTIGISLMIFLFGTLELNLYFKLTLSILISITLYPLVIYKFSLEDKQRELFAGMINKMIKYKR